MKIKSFGFLTAVTILFSACNANANPLFDIYAGGTYGFGEYFLFSGDEHPRFSAQSYGAVLGMDIPVFRFELEYNYINGDNLSMNFGFINAYLKMPTPIFKPYIGAGVGSSFSSKFTPDAAPEFDLEDVMGYQGMLGLTVDIPVFRFDIDLEGRVLYSPDIFEDVAQDITPDLLQYEGRVKLRYIF